MDGNREAYDRFAAVAREAYETLAQNLNENADQPLEASRLATNAFQKALKKHQKPVFGKNQFGGRYNTTSVTNQVGTRRRKGRRIYANNDIVIVVYKRKRR